MQELTLENEKKHMTGSTLLLRRPDVFISSSSSQYVLYIGYFICKRKNRDIFATVYNVVELLTQAWLSHACIEHVLVSFMSLILACQESKLDICFMFLTLSFLIELRKTLPTNELQN